MTSRISVSFFYNDEKNEANDEIVNHAIAENLEWENITTLPKVGEEIFFGFDGIEKFACTNVKVLRVEKTYLVGNELTLLIDITLDIEKP